MMVVGGYNGGSFYDTVEVIDLTGNHPSTRIQSCSLGAEWVKM